MILTCPECATRYFVDGAKLGADGRTVRCVGCGNRWHANLSDLDDEAVAEPAAPAAPRPEPDTAAPAVAIAAPGDPLPQAFRAATVAKRKMRKAVVAGAVWGGLGVVALALLATAAIFRVDVVHMWPRTAGAYAKVGLTVNPTGLAPEGVQAIPGLQNGQLAIVVSGMVRNVETHPRASAPLKVSLLDKNGHAVKDMILPATPGDIAPGQARGFKATFIDPPAAGVNAQVEFILDHHAPAAHGKANSHGKAGAHGKPDAHAAPAHGAGHPPAAGHAPDPHAPAAHPPAAAVHHAPIPVAARALPADSPYALPAAALPDHSIPASKPAPKPPAAKAADAGHGKPHPPAPHG